MVVLALNCDDTNGIIINSKYTTNATAGILIRSDGAPGNADKNHYYLGLYPGEDMWRLWLTTYDPQTQSTTWTMIDSSDPSDDITIDLDRYYTLSATAQYDAQAGTSNITLYLDGEQLGDPISDSTHTSGHVGLRVRNGAALFDDVRAEGLSYGSPTSYIYNEATGALMHELDESGQVVKTYIADDEGNPVAVAIRQPDGSFNTYYYHTNAHGDVTAITDEGGDIIASFSYDPWGVPTEYDSDGNIAQIGSWAGTPGDGLFYLFGGMLYDALAGIYLTKTRAYDPKRGRFLERDILDEDQKGGYRGFPFGADAIGTNLYAWCKNNPVNRIDPSGMWFGWYKRARATVALNRYMRIFRFQSRPVVRFTPRPSTGGRPRTPVPPSYGAFRNGWGTRPWTWQGKSGMSTSISKPPPKVTTKVANINVTVQANIQPSAGSSRSPYWGDVADDLEGMVYSQAAVAAASGQVLTDGACGNLCNGAILTFGGLAGRKVASNWHENEAAYNRGENGTPRYIYNQTVTVVEALPTQVGQTVAALHLGWDAGNALLDEAWSLFS